MHLEFRNVNDAFRKCVRGFQFPEGEGIVKISRKPSRVGEVLQIDEPMTLTYKKPLERVLFNTARDANPFFHMFEALWMLAGRNDVEPLKYYSSTIADIASDDGKTFNGAYGYRWRNRVVDKDVYVDGNPHPSSRAKGRIDQLGVLIEHLKKNPGSRRAVLQMWNVEDDLLKVDVTKDVCCNLSILFSIREGGAIDTAEEWGKEIKRLDMTVFNRSNDLIWGALGANYAHFTILQEYMAACLGIGVGVYNQISNNLHVYTSRFEPEKWLAESDQPNYDWTFKLIPLVQIPDQFDREVVEFIETPYGDYQEPFLQHVAGPMCAAFRFHKERNYAQALKAALAIQDGAWRWTSMAWLKRREQMYLSKQEQSKW